MVIAVRGVHLGRLTGLSFLPISVWTFLTFFSFKSDAKTFSNLLVNLLLPSLTLFSLINSPQVIQLPDSATLREGAIAADTPCYPRSDCTDLCSIRTPPSTSTSDHFWCRECVPDTPQQKTDIEQRKRPAAPAIKKTKNCVTWSET